RVVVAVTVTLSPAANRSTFRSLKKASGSVIVVSNEADWSRMLWIDVVAFFEVTSTPVTAAILQMSRSSSQSRVRRKRTFRTQLSSRGLWMVLLKSGMPFVSAGTTLKVPVKWRWIVTTAVVGRPVESVSENAKSNDRLALVIVRQNRRGSIAVVPES